MNTNTSDPVARFRAIINSQPLPLVIPRPAGYMRFGVVARTDETEKMEIAGLPCGVTKESETEARVYVFIEGKSAKGPYMLKPCEILAQG